MFRFEKEQKIINAGGIKVGGQPGEVPTALTGTIFYIGHKIVKDKKEGIFDKARAETLINRMEELSDMTTNPFILEGLKTVRPIRNLKNYLKLLQLPIGCCQIWRNILRGSSCLHILSGEVKTVSVDRRATPESYQLKTCWDICDFR